VKTSSAVALETEPESSRDAWRIFNPPKSHFDSQKLSYSSFFPKSEKPIKAVIRHLPHNTPAEDISDCLVSLGFHVVSVKQMTATRRSLPVESEIINLPLFFVTLPRTAKYV
jgi:hypothetical protein